MADFDRESMMEMFIYEMTTLLEQLEGIVLQGDDGYDSSQINEIFRIMHTLKGSAAMMLFENISTMAHRMEDVFFYLREENPEEVDNEVLTDIILEGTDFIKTEIYKIEAGEESDGDPEDLIEPIVEFLKDLKGETDKAEESLVQKATASETNKTVENSSTGKYKYKAKIFFDDDSDMSNVRAYALVHNFNQYTTRLIHTPNDLIDESSAEVINSAGFLIDFETDLDYDEVNSLLEKTIYLRSLELEQVGHMSESGQPNDSNKNTFHAILTYDDGCEMENVRAFALIKEANKLFDNITHNPQDLEDIASLDIIRKNGFEIIIETEKSFEEVDEFLQKTIYMKELKLEKVENSPIQVTEAGIKTENTEPAAEAETAETIIVKEKPKKKKEKKKVENKPKTGPPGQAFISVNVSRLDNLLNLMGELVIAEAMVTQNPELEGLELESFYKETRQLRKIITDVQDTVMSMRMIPLSPTFFKMHRIVRDMCRSLEKDVDLVIIGEDTEVDKNITEHISDPLMHVIRNSIDHGIEMPDERRSKGKNPKGQVTLEAKHSGGDVLIIVKDDGKGLDRDKILKKAKANGLLEKREEQYTDKEIYQFIFLAGFSTNEQVTGFSGRGVGMDVVTTNLEAVGGSISVDSTQDEGSVFTMKIPLTLAIIEGMTIKLGDAKYTIPIVSIKQSFKISSDEIFKDPNGNEMITIREEVYNIIRLDEFFNVPSYSDSVEDATLIMIENGDQMVCLMVDELIGEQQVVVKTIPKYIKRIQGISGCTLLGNGEISLIIDVAGFFDR